MLTMNLVSSQCRADKFCTGVKYALTKKKTKTKLHTCGPPLEKERERFTKRTFEPWKGSKITPIHSRLCSLYTRLAG